VFTDDYAAEHAPIVLLASRLSKSQDASKKSPEGFDDTNARRTPRSPFRPRPNDDEDSSRASKRARRVSPLASKLGEDGHDEIDFLSSRQSSPITLRTGRMITETSGSSNTPIKLEDNTTEMPQEQSPQRAYVIPLPITATGDSQLFEFPPEADEIAALVAEAHTLASDYTLPYTLPLLKELPPEFNRKGRLTKQQRKREKEREKGSDNGRRDEWVPMGVNRWGATVQANPVWKSLARSNKCVTSREWTVSKLFHAGCHVFVTPPQVAMTELRLIRALERVEKLKDAGKWSFRQIRRHRGIGHSQKTHWDHLLDEMVSSFDGPGKPMSDTRI
jgi:chromatin modification-related protein VID21